MRWCYNVFPEEAFFLIREKALFCHGYKGLKQMVHFLFCSLLYLTSERVLLHAGFFSPFCVTTKSGTFSTPTTTAFVHHTFKIHPHLLSLMNLIFTLSFCLVCRTTELLRGMIRPLRDDEMVVVVVVDALALHSSSFPFRRRRHCVVGSAGPN